MTTKAEYNRRWTEQNPERRRELNIAADLRRYGLTPAEYAAMFEAQGGLCAICRLPESALYNGRPKRMSVDHDHDSGRVRGLLCTRCNQGIGHLRHNRNLLATAIVYLEATDGDR